MFHRGWRDHALAALGGSFDVLVAGGGITGCGVLLDAAQRGLRVLLVDKADFASGTSSRSSKLIHGGLRYLKQLQFGVTVSAARERERMLALNPELVRPLRFVYPSHRGDRLPAWTVDIGLWMYDRLTRRVERHDHLETAEVERLLPGLATDDLSEAFAYTDAAADDARLTLAVAATGFAYGGLALTRAEVVEITRDAGGELTGAVIRDLESGVAHRVAAHVVVNATGVWVDELRALAGCEERRLRPSRGIHLVLPTARLPLATAAMVPSPDDGRPVFLIPHEEGVLVGTTDVYHDGSLDDPRPTTAEVAYLLRTLAAHFPERRLDVADLVGVFAGLRPILDVDSDDPSAVSREEAIWRERGMLSVAGGKLTTWRPTAEQAVDQLVEMLPAERQERVTQCRTEGTPLAGLAPIDLGERLVAAHGLAPAIAHAMARRLRAAAAWAPRLARDRGELAPLADGADLTAAEVRVHLAHGAVLRLEDLLLRRARLGMWSPELALRVAPRLAPLCADELGWDGARFERELAAYEEAARGWTPAGVVEA